MSEPWVTAVISAGSAFAGGLLSIFLTPTLQPHFWKSQRRSEVRLAAIDEINDIAAQFILRTPAGPYTPGAKFHRRLISAIAKLRCWFSDDAFQAFKRMEVRRRQRINDRF